MSSNHNQKYQKIITSTHFHLSKQKKMERSQKVDVMKIKWKENDKILA